MEKKRQEYQKKYDELAEAGDDAWEHLKEGIETAWKDLEQAVDGAAKQPDNESAKGTQ